MITETAASRCWCSCCGGVVIVSGRGWTGRCLVVRFEFAVSIVVKVICEVDWFVVCTIADVVVLGFVGVILVVGHCGVLIVD